jgi:hypothetical protein
MAEGLGASAPAGFRDRAAWGLRHGLGGAGAVNPIQQAGLLKAWERGRLKLRFILKTFRFVRLWGLPVKGTQQ